MADRVPWGITKRIRGVLFRSSRANVDTYGDVESRSTDELLSIVRNEAHRIEKLVYNGIFVAKRDELEQKRERIATIQGLLHERGVPSLKPTLAWPMEIHDAFSDLEAGPIGPRSRPAEVFAPQRAEEMLNLFRGRRSCRVWAED